MKNKKIFLAGVGLFTAIVGGFIYLSLSQSNTTQKIQITTSFYPLYYFTSQIVGDLANVYNITPSGAEPHDYDPSTLDMARIQDSQLLILNGGKLEAWGDNVRTALLGTETKVLTVGETIFNQTNQEYTPIDPHIWLDPVLAKEEVKNIALAVEQIDPQNAKIYETNAKGVEERLDDLDQEFKTQLNSCEKKDIITSHSAFAYVAKRYGFNQIAIAGVSPDEEPSPQVLASITDFARRNGVEYIFFESLMSPKLAETIAQEVGVKTLVLNPIEGLNTQEIAAGKNYFTEMEQNLRNLKLALQCE